MKRILIGIAAAAFAVTAAFAADDLMTVYFGNTLAATDANGTTKILYNADHTWSSSGPQGATSGTWELKNGTSLCVTQTAPPPPANAAAPGCVTIEAHKVGDTWSYTPQGAPGPTTLSVVAGR